MSALHFDAELIGRYDGAGPRYTSYPTAVQFRQNFGEDCYREAARGRKSSTDPLSLYIHLPFCSSPCFYCACNRIITRSADRGAAYLARLGREIELQASLFDRRRPIEQLHLGGGTPTFYSTAQLADLMDQLGKHFRLTESGREYSIEIDPRTVSAASVAELARLGFNRMSLGVQDFNAVVQSAINRVQPGADTLRVVEAARAAGVDSVSFDLIYGLPKQTVSGFEGTLNTVLQARPDRLAVYAYAHMPHLFTAQRRLAAQDLPTPSMRLEILRLTIDMLTAAGYVYVGMDHFALPGDELVQAKEQGTLQRNFQGYSTRALHDLIGMGVSAIGKVGQTYAQNQKSLPDYYAAIDSGHLPTQRGIQLSEDDRIRAAVIQQLMCHEIVRMPEIEGRFDIDFRRYFREELERLVPLEEDGLVVVTSHAIAVTARGRLLLRNVAMAFDSYLQHRLAQPVYSRVI